jgi:ATP-dependent DNA helicase RecG
MESEGDRREYKSVLKIRNGLTGLKDLAATCVAFANTQGGDIFIGIENGSRIPPSGQNITKEEVNDAITRLRTLCYNVSITPSTILKDSNGGDYFIITVSPSVKSIASTADGKLFVRVGDETQPVRSEDIMHLASEKQAFQWELVCTRKVLLTDANISSLKDFADKIRHSDRVSEHIVQMADYEIAENYNLLEGDCLTNLGILWIGTPAQRSHVSYPISVQYIVYDALENKVRKLDWHDNLLNPLEMLLDIEKKAVELTYSYDFPDGLFRKQIRQYNPKVIRELLINAFSHHSFTTAGDIVIKVFVDRIEISNPGGLPLGVTKDNILHKSKRRNPAFARIMQDFKLMENEGSGYDLIYQLNAMDSKKMPVVESDFSQVVVTQYSGIIDEDILPILDYVGKNYELSQKDMIALGIIAQRQKLLSTELSNLLQLENKERLRAYTDRLLKMGLVKSRGIKKGTEFLISPELINSAKANVKTTLKTIEPYRLEALIEEDIRRHPDSSVSEIVKRLPDASYKDIRKHIYAMTASGIIIPVGINRWRRYRLAGGMAKNK